MRYEYVVVLKRNRERDINIISIILCGLSILAFVFHQVRSGEINLFLSLGVLLIAAGMGLNIFFTKRKKTNPFRTWLFLSGIFWLGMPYLKFLAIPFFLLGILEYQARYPLEIGFSKEEITINTLIRRRYPWSDLNRVLLKDGLLTLDFRNNRLFQRETEEDDEPDAEEDEFNLYCRERLAASRSGAEKGHEE